MANHRRRPAGATKYLVGFRDNRILLHSLATVRLWSCGSATCCRLHPDSVVGHHWWLQASNFVSHHSRVTLISCRLAAQKDWSPSWPWQQATEVVSRLCVGRCPTPGASRHTSARALLRTSQQLGRPFCRISHKVYTTIERPSLDFSSQKRPEVTKHIFRFARVASSAKISVFFPKIQQKHATSSCRRRGRKAWLLGTAGRIFSLSINLVLRDEDEK